MAKRRFRFDLAGRLDGAQPGLLTQIGVATALMVVVGVTRILIELYTQGVAPFALLYPAVLAATLMAGWLSGVMVMASGGLIAWFVLLHRLYGSPEGEQADAVSVALYVVAASAIIVFAESYRKSARARVAGQAALAESEARLELATSAARVGVWEWRPQSNEMIYSEEAKAICGFPAGEPVTYAMVEAVTHPDDLPNTLAQAARALNPAIRDETPYEYRLRRADGTERWVVANGRAVFEMVGGMPLATRYVGTIQDVTDRRDAEERVKLLAREVDHRANNLLTVVQGTVQLSQAPTPEALKTVLSGRIAALGRAHQLLSEARWVGADLRRLVEEELLAFSLGEATRVSIDGPDVALSPAAAQALAMALHELATNAAKYGSLSVPAGQVAVSWSRRSLGAGQGGLSIRWAEHGGPAVAKPSRRGLGTAMLARALAGPLGGRSRLDWRPEGLVCDLELPDTAMEAAATAV